MRRSSRPPLRGSGQPPRAVGGTGQQRIEQLPHDAEGQLALEVAPAGGEHAEAGRLGRFASGAQQPALPDPRRSLDKSEPVKEQVAQAASDVRDHLREPAREAAESVRSKATDATATVKDDAQSAAADLRSGQGSTVT